MRLAYDREKIEEIVSEVLEDLGLLASMPGFHFIKAMTVEISTNTFSYYSDANFLYDSVAQICENQGAVVNKTIRFTFKNMWGEGRIYCGAKRLPQNLIIGRHLARRVRDIYRERYCREV